MWRFPVKYNHSVRLHFGEGVMLKSEYLGRREFLGIAAGTVLAARVGSSETVAVGEPFNFAVIADPHCAEAPKTGLEAYGNGVEKFLRCFERMKELPKEEQPDFALVAGDIHPEALAPHLDKITLPLHVVAGNHEGSAETRGLLRAMFPQDFGSGDAVRDYYAFTYKGIRFIAVCDAGAGGDHIGHFSSELIEPHGQCDWLEKELRGPEPRKVLFAHIPPALDDVERNMYLGRNDSRWFLEQVRQTEPEMLFFGHLHHPTEENRIGNTRSVNVRSCCWNFQNAPVGFLLVRVGTESMETREIITGTCADKA
ncbi:MAG: Calcineurin-like phosphoesterase superfamily domain protein [Candidatus Hydrogenedentes bacterium ADurb.Bin101]|nr:MAG: Calcineurin-like phosphoesterase superfamily domain protein [Candidatus Hydrogenedentes bacterium ADurb.Bin101]HOC68188.1 metallophosphoesterase [Candidatus Hydrogenedentota bacterium]